MTFISKLALIAIAVSLGVLALAWGIGQAIDGSEPNTDLSGAVLEACDVEPDQVEFISKPPNGEGWTTAHYEISGDDRYKGATVEVTPQGEPYQTRCLP